MLYSFDKKELKYKRVGLSKLFILISLFMLVITIFLIILIDNIKDVKIITSETRAIIIRENDKFSRDKLKEYIIELNIRFPHIVYAQAILETGNFRSSIFLENNNLFGMKVSKLRPTTNKGEENNHAYYNNWKESVQDYAFFQATYLNKIKTEEEYFEYLSVNYAENHFYIDILKKIIKNNK
jgi:hypothetical protein